MSDPHAYDGHLARMIQELTRRGWQIGTASSGAPTAVRTIELSSSLTNPSLGAPEPQRSANKEILLGQYLRYELDLLTREAREIEKFWNLPVNSDDVSPINFDEAISIEVQDVGDPKFITVVQSTDTSDPVMGHLSLVIAQEDFSCETFDLKAESYLIKEGGARTAEGITVGSLHRVERDFARELLFLPKDEAHRRMHERTDPLQKPVISPMDREERDRLYGKMPGE